MKKILSITMMMVAMMVATFSFSSCSSDDDDNKTVTYGMGFDKVESSNLEEMAKISNTFQQAIGKVDGVKFTGLGSSEFIYSGSEDKIKEACKLAEGALANEAISGTYVFVVYKNNAKKTNVYTYMVNVLQ
jgi:hypothetical protein